MPTIRSSLKSGESHCLYIYNCVSTRERLALTGANIRNCLLLTRPVLTKLQTEDPDKDAKFNANEAIKMIP